MTNKLKQITLILIFILAIALTIFLPFFLTNILALRSIQIMVLLALLIGLIARIYYLEKRKKEINYKNAFQLVMFSILLILAGRLIYDYITKV